MLHLLELYSVIGAIKEEINHRQFNFYFSNSKLIYFYGSEKLIEAITL